jgi:hypothetical protein
MEFPAPRPAGRGKFNGQIVGANEIERVADDRFNFAASL